MNKATTITTLETLSFKKGIQDGFPICLGYLSVSFTFGIAASLGGLPIWAAVLTSLTNLTSAGQFAGLSLMFAGGSLLEMVLTTFVINLRYALMSFSLSQKLTSRFSLVDRLLVSFVNTDEIFAVAVSQKSPLNRKYMLGLAITPYFGWAFGTLLGAAAGSFLPAMILSALGIAIYGMFIAIVVPVARQFKNVLAVVGISIILSCLFRYMPYLNKLSGGFVIIICTVIAAAIGAVWFPVKEVETQTEVA